MLQPHVRNFRGALTLATISLWRGIQRNTGSGGFSIIHVNAQPGQEVKVRLCVVAGEEHRYTLSIGGTFPVRDEIWRLSRVEGLPSDDWTVVLDKVSPVLPESPMLPKAGAESTTAATGVVAEALDGDNELHLIRTCFVTTPDRDVIAVFVIDGRCYTYPHQARQAYDEARTEMRRRRAAWGWESHPVSPSEPPPWLPSWEEYRVNLDEKHPVPDDGE